jgi:lipoate-protein ligase A
VRFATTAAGEQAWNDAALAKGGEGPWSRVWSWPQPAIVLGRAQSRQLEAVQAAAGPDTPVLARSSGGGAVLCGPWLIGSSVVLPVRHRLLGEGLIPAYRWLGEVHSELLSRIGVSAELLAPERVLQVSERVAGGPVQWACFGGLSPWELVDSGGRKLVGLAQQRRRDAVLLVSGLLLATPPWTLLCEALGRQADEERLATRTTSVEALLGRSFDLRGVSEVAAQLEALMFEALNCA